MIYQMCLLQICIYCPEANTDNRPSPLHHATRALHTYQPLPDQARRVVEGALRARGSVPAARSEQLGGGG